MRRVLVVAEAGQAPKSERRRRSGGWLLVVRPLVVAGECRLLVQADAVVAF